MPLIQLPPIDDDDEIRQPESNQNWLDWVKSEFNKPHLAWFCPICNLKNFYANKYCPYCWIRNRVQTLKPGG